MSDTNEAGSLTATGSGKSEAEVAFELLNKLKGQGVWGERNLSAILDMYAECLDAAKGLRAYEGQNRIDTPIKAGVSAARPQAQAPVQVQAQPQAAAPVQAQAVPAQQQAPRPAAPVQPQAQPVHAQQAAVQQAYQQPDILLPQAKPA